MDISQGKKPVRIAWVAWITVVVLAVLASVWIDLGFLRTVTADWPKFPVDFAVFWTAPRIPLSRIYDIETMTRAQDWIVVNPADPRPYTYPPTFLFFLQPLRAMPFMPAFLAWVAVGVVAYAAAARMIVGRVWPLALVSPAVMVAMLTGQVTLFVAAGLTAAVVWLPARPLLAGVLLGVLATIKPQGLVLVPLALLVAGHHRALIAALVTGGAIGLASLWAHGIEVWMQWPGMLDRFSQIIDAKTWIGITPKAVTRLIGLEGPAQLAVMAAGGALGVWLVVRTFRKTLDPAERLLALTTGYYLITPYALMYELALVQPAAVAMMLGGRGPLRRVAGLVAFTAITRPLATFMLALCALPVWPQPRAAAPPKAAAPLGPTAQGGGPGK